MIRNMAMKGPCQVIFGGISQIYPLDAAQAATATLGRLLEAIHREQRRLGLNKRSEEPLAGSACVAHGGRQGAWSIRRRGRRARSAR